MQESVVGASFEICGGNTIQDGVPFRGGDDGVLEVSMAEAELRRSSGAVRNVPERSEDDRRCEFGGRRCCCENDSSGKV